MSSGYCSLDEDSEDFTFFTAKTSFFCNSQQGAKGPKGPKVRGTRAPWQGRGNGEGRGGAEGGVFQ